MRFDVLKNKVPAVLLAAVIAATLLTACKGNTESFAYIHDPGTEIIALSDNGKAVYKGSKYSYTKDDSFINLTDAAGAVTSLRYVPTKEGMILYERSTYTYDGEGEPDGIIGNWTQDNGWAFQFTDKGTFAEENIFFGHYLVDEENGTIKLMYSDPIEDSLLYYSLDGKNLTIDYPWPMVPTEGK